jgi:hypothetical protein
MRKVAIFVAGALLASAVTARTQARPQPVVSYASRIFMGSLFDDIQSTGEDQIGGSLEAKNPTCTLTPHVNEPTVESGVGPNGSLQLDGSNECPGVYDVYFSGGNPIAQGRASSPLQGSGASSIGGVASGTFVAVDDSDHTTVNWAGTYTVVYDYSTTEQNSTPACPQGFCADIGQPADLSLSGPAVVLELNGFTWNVSRHG